MKKDVVTAIFLPECAFMEEHMRKTEERRAGWLSAAFVATTFLLVIVMGLALHNFSFISHAEEQATVSVTAATIRKEASVSSEAIGSAMQGDSVTIKSEVTGADGMVWYQVYVNSETLGYIRSDLVTKADGSGTPNTAPPASNTQVTEVQPQSATVTGGQGRIRADASAGSSIVTTVQNDVVLTVTGQAVDSENVVWYRVVFIENGSEVTGFVRNDYVTLAGDLVPVGEGGETPPADVPESSEQPSDVPDIGGAEDAPYAVQLIDGVWCLVNIEAEQGYEIEELLVGTEKNGQLYEEARKTVKGQKIAIIILVILLVAAVLAATMLFFKMKDVMDEAYFKAVEKETIRERGSSRKVGSPDRKVMQTVGLEPEKSEVPVRTKTAAAAGRPGPQSRPAAGPGGQPAKSPVKTQPQKSGGQEQPSRTAGGQEQPSRQQPRQGQPRPVIRPQGNVQGRPGAEQGQPPRQQPRQAPHPDQRQPVRGGAPRQSAVPEQPNPGWKSKNFMTDDDEFEFEFLNWDGDDN